MKKKIKLIDLSQIDSSDQLFKISTPTHQNVILESVQDMGILTPLWVQKKAKYRLVCGFKRYYAAKALGFEQVPVYVIDSSFSGLDVFSFALKENQVVRSFNPIEISYIIKKLLDDFGQSKRSIIHTYFPLINLAKNPRLFELFSPLFRLEKEWQLALIDDRLSTEMANQLLTLSKNEKRFLYGLFNKLQLNKNKQKEFTRLLEDLSAKFRITMVDIFERTDINEIYKDTKLTPQQKAEKIKIILKRLRYPLYTKTEQKFKNIIKQANPPANVQIKASPFFERGTYSMIFTFKNQAEFTKTLTFLQFFKDTIVEQLENIHE